VPQSFDENYYLNNGQLNDRPALGWYARLARRFLDTEQMLDFGCGTGTLMLRLSKLGKIDGFDLSNFALEKAKILNPQSKFFSAISQIDSKKYSAVVSIHVVEHLTPAELTLAISSLRKSLKARGRILLVTPQYDGFAHRRLKSNWDGFKDSSHCNLLSIHEVRKLMNDGGFKMIKEMTDGPWNGPYFTKAKIEKLLLQIPCAIQVFTGQKIIPTGFGESYVGIWEIVST